MFGPTSPQTSLILAFDPGKTTGFCLIKTPLDVVEYGQLTLPSNVSRAITKYHEYAGVSEVPFRVVYERFVLAPTKSKNLSWDSMPAAQIIGIIEETCIKLDIPIYQQSSSMKTFFSDGLMRHLGAYWKGRPHAVDAARHAFYHAWFVMGHKDTIEVSGALYQYARKE